MADGISVFFSVLPLIPATALLIFFLFKIVEAKFTKKKEAEFYAKYNIDQFGNIQIVVGRTDVKETKSFYLNLPRSDWEKIGRGRNFTPKPQPKKPERSCWVVLGIASNSTIDEINKAYNKLAKIHHPDLGGSTAKMAELNIARDTALRSKK